MSDELNLTDAPVAPSGVWISRYRLKPRSRLNAISSRRELEGVVIRIGHGYGCLQPWPELGDPPLQKCLEDLAGPRRRSIVRRAVRCAEMDGAARENEESLFEDLDVPLSHATVPTYEAAEISRAVEAGFEVVKLKGGRDLERLAEFLTEQSAEYPSLRWRLDFNETGEAEMIAAFLNGLPKETRRRIDFVEDPCPYSDSTWTSLKQTTGVRLAVDREAAPICAAAQVMVLKPALDEPWLLAEAAVNRGQQVVVTSYMDHPLGQAFAAWEAARLELTFRGLLGVCGLQTHHLSEPDAFTELLGPWSPRFQSPGGTGLGFDDLLDALPWTRLV
jgi:O-succinylbenzoate synthase